MSQVSVTKAKERAFPLRLKVGAGIALLHLGMVILGLAQVDFSRLGPLGRALDFYGNLTGSAYTYGFFAPGIDGQVGVFFDVVDTGGKNHRVQLQTGISGEADLRVTDILEQFIPEDEDTLDKPLARSLSASLARVFFVRYPGSRQVAVSLEYFNPVSMGDFVAGKRAVWKPVYQARYAYDGGHAR